ncbi:MAG: hypothetical protein HY006_00260 [Candidatus Sungbacteria bacterium]|nr:hypothetical protein [Candidatus Sungbacteria bacterium]
MTKQKTLMAGVVTFFMFTIPLLVFSEAVEEFSEDVDQMNPEVASFFEKVDEALGFKIDKLIKPTFGDVSIPYFFAIQGPISKDGVPIEVAIGIGITYRIARHPVQRMLRYHAGWRAPLSRIREESLVTEAVAWYMHCADKLINWRWGAPLDILDPNLVTFIERMEHHFFVPEQQLGVREGDDERPTLIVDYLETPAPGKEKLVMVSGALEFAPLGIIERLQRRGEHFIARGRFNAETDYNRVGAMVAKGAFRMLIELYHHKEPLPAPFFKKRII